MVALCATASGAWGQQTNLVTNGSFEANGGSFQGWTISGSDGSGPGLGPEIIATDGSTAGRFGDVIKPDPFTDSPDASGTHAAYFVDDDASETLSQVFQVNAGIDYEVGFDFYLTTSGARNSGAFSLTATVGGQPVTTVASTQTNQIATWYHIFATFVPTVSGAASYVFSFVSANTTSKDVIVDDVYVTTQPVSNGSQNTPVAYVPEPPALPILALSVTALGWLSRRRRVA